MNIDLYHLVKDKSRIEKILDFLPYPFIISEFRFGTYRNVYLNKRFLEQIGYTIEEIPTIEDWFEKAYPDPDYRYEVIQRWTNNIEQAKRSGEDAGVLQVMIHTKTGGNKWFEVKASIAGGMQLIAFVSMEESMTKEKDLKKLIENKDRTLSILAHDLRVPITNLHSLTHLLLTEKITPAEFIEKVRQVHEKSSQVLEFIDTMLYWTRSNFATIQVKKEDVPLKETILNILSLYENAYQKKNIAISINMNGEKLRTDTGIITILLRNVISNAIKFTGDGGSISIHGKNDRHNFCISVKDSGVGMNRDVIEMIRKDTYISTRGTHQEKGLGIGLKLCHQLVQKLDATLEIESEPGKGTLVNLVFKKD